MKNSLHQTAFLNAPQSERIFPTSVGNFAVRNPYSIVQHSERALTKLCYELRNAKERIARHWNHLTFLYRCREKKIFPKGLQVKLPLKTPKTGKIAFRTTMTLLHECLYDVRRVIRKAKGDLTRHKNELRSLTTDARFRQIDV